MVSNKFDHDLPVLALDAADIVATVMKHDRRVFLFGPMGAGKSSIAAKLADDHRCIQSIMLVCQCRSGFTGFWCAGFCVDSKVAKRNMAGD